MVLRLYGAETLKSYIKNHIKLAKDLEQLVSQDPNFEVSVKLMLKTFWKMILWQQRDIYNAFFFVWQVVTPRIFSLVCFRIVPVDNDEKTCNNLNRSLLDAVNSSGKLFISHTVSISLSFVLLSSLLDNVVKLRCVYMYLVFPWQTDLVWKIRTTFGHRSTTDGGEARDGRMEGYPGRSIFLACFSSKIRLKKNFMRKPPVLANKPKHTSLVCYNLIWYHIKSYNLSNAGLVICKQVCIFCLIIFL